MHDHSPPAIRCGNQSLEERLEKGELIFFPECPFALPREEDRQFLIQQHLRPLSRKHITYDPTRNQIKGFLRISADQQERLRTILAGFSQSVTGWLLNTLPGYRGGCQRDRASFRPEEEATRRLRHLARNDLLHIDAFPNRPSQGRRILRVWVNCNPSEPRVWITSELLARVLERYGTRLGVAGLERSTWLNRLSERLLRLLLPDRPIRSAYDSFMLRLHDALKRDDEFQERSPKRLWTFPPGSAWILFSDARTHAELRGQFALEHSFFIEPGVLVCPNLSPLALVTGQTARLPLPTAA